jgi:hypothetical protein
LNKRFKYFLGLFLSVFFLNAQLFNLPLSNAGLQMHGAHVYCYGFSKNQLMIYKINSDSQKLDSMGFNLTQNSDNYFQTFADTLHQYLNIYLMEKNSKAYQIYRYNKNFELLANPANIEAGRLNNTILFGDNFLYSNHNVFAIKTINDSSGTQFYLNKYVLKSRTENFDYALKWQYPFERKNIFSVSIVDVSEKCVRLLASVYKGLKEGEWLLMLDVEKGTLIKAIKLNNKLQKEILMQPKIYFDRMDKSMHLFGQKFEPNQYAPLSNVLSIGGASVANVYHIQIDSLNEIINRWEYKIPLNNSNTGAKKILQGFVLKINSVHKKLDNGLELDLDVWKNENNAVCFYYCNSQVIKLIKTEDNYVIQKSVIVANPLIESYYRTPDKQNQNGKLCLENFSQLNSLFSQKQKTPIKLFSKTDELGNLISVFSKLEQNKNNFNVSILSPIKNQFQVSNLFNTKPGYRPTVYKLNNTKFVIGAQSEENIYQLNFFKW